MSAQLTKKIKSSMRLTLLLRKTADSTMMAYVKEPESIYFIRRKSTTKI